MIELRMQNDCPGEVLGRARRVAEETLLLPMFPNLTDAQVDQIISTVGETCLYQIVVRLRKKS